MRLRLSTFLVVIAALTVMLSLTLSRLHFPTAMERVAIRSAVTLHATTYGDSVAGIYRTREIEARPLKGGNWQVRITRIINPQPGGYRITTGYAVDRNGKSHYLGIIEGGDY